MSGGNGRDAILQERHIVEVKLSDLQSEFLRREYRLAKWCPRGGRRPHWTRGRGISRPPGAVKRLMASTSELERRVLWVWIP